MSPEAAEVQARNCPDECDLRARGNAPLDSASSSPHGHERPQRTGGEHMSTRSYRRRTPRRLASALGAAVVLALAASSPALAADVDGNHTLDPDNVRAGNTAASFGDGTLDAQQWTDDGTMTWYYDRDAKRIRGE